MLAPQNGIELKSKRSLNAKHYDVGGGNFQGNFSPGHVHYDNKLLVGDGEPGLREIDWTLTEKETGGWTFLYHSFNPDIPEYADDWLTFRDLFESKDQTVGFKPVCSHVKGTLVQSIEGLTDINAVVYTDAFGTGIDYIVYFTRSQMLKCVRIREKESKDYAFKFELQVPESCTIWRVGDIEYELDTTRPKDFDTQKNTEIRTQDGATLFKQFKVWDSEKSQVCVVSYSLEDGKMYLTKHVPQAFIDASVGDVFTDTTTTYYAGAGDGYTRRYNATGTTWNDLVTGNGDLEVHSNATLVTGLADWTDDVKWQYIFRGHLPFVTSIQTSAVISDISIYLYGALATTDYYTSFYNVCKTAQASSTTLASSDYQTFVRTALSDTAIAHASINLSGYNVWSFNSSAIAGFTKGTNKGNYYGITTTFDITNTEPSTHATPGVRDESNVGFQTSETASTNKDPYLSITYTYPSGTSPMWFMM